MKGKQTNVFCEGRGVLTHLMQAVAIFLQETFVETESNGLKVPGLTFRWDH